MLARVAELEDAVDLKSIVRKGVWVRVPPRACPKPRESHLGNGANRPVITCTYQSPIPVSLVDALPQATRERALAVLK